MQSILLTQQFNHDKMIYYTILFLRLYIAKLEHINIMLKDYKTLTYSLKPMHIIDGIYYVTYKL
jgi:hypothetical protein